MTPQAALIELLGRVGASQGAAVLINADELSQWPTEAVAAMKTQRLLTKTRNASSAICPGCERDCVMRVHVIPAEDNWPARAFISCYERDDIGHVPVDFSRLEQWQTTGDLFAAALANLLGFSQPSTQAVDGKQWGIGTLRGMKHNSSVKLLAGDGLTLSLAGHIVPLATVLTIEDKSLTLDKAELICLVDNPAGDSKDTDTAEIEGFGFDNDEAEKYATANAKSSVSAMQIRMHFVVISTGEDANHEWWKKMMRNASDNGLNMCRVGGGKKGRGGSLWRPDQIAGWLVDRHERNFEGVSNNSARAALKKFTGYEETADEMFPKGE